MSGAALEPLDRVSAAGIGDMTDLARVACRQYGITKVFPPKAAARVALAKSSAITMPGPDG